MAKLIFGCGYLGQRVAKLWQNAGETVFAVTRSPDRAAQFASAGIVPLVADISQPDSLKIALQTAETAATNETAPRREPPAENPPDSLANVATVLFAVGYDRPLGKSILDVYTSGLRNALAVLPRTVQRFIYISSTGVYGQNRGEWVNENSPCLPTREGGQACLAAEQILAEHPLGSRAVVLRLAGLYGPGRIPRSQELLAGHPIAAPNAGYLNLIHVEDAAAIVLAAEQRANPPALYLVSDGEPVPRQEYYRELARLLGAPEPRFENAPLNSPAAARAGADKRICNERLRQEIFQAFAYPSYREGLAAIVKNREAPSS